MREKFVRLCGLVLACMLIFSGCKDKTDNHLSEQRNPVATDVVNFSQQENEPLTFQLEVTDEGKVIVPIDGTKMDGFIWTGWVTEDGKEFDFTSKVTDDITLTCTFYPDANNNGIVDRTPEDPVTIYQFYHSAGFVMQTEAFFGKDVAFDYNDSTYGYPASEDDGQIFLGWLLERTESEDGAVITCALMPNLAPDRNNNDLADGSKEDPYVYYVFLMEDGRVLLEIEWISGEKAVNVADVTYPGVTKDKMLGWIESVSTNEAGYVVHTFTPNLAEGE